MMMDFGTTFRSVLRRGTAVGIGLLALLIVVSGCDSEDLGDANPETPSVGDYVSQVTAMSTLNEAVQEVGLEALENDGITLFAPLNGAFEPAIDPTLNEEALRNVLEHHIVDGEVTTDQLEEGEQSVTPLAGKDLTITVGDEVTVNRATVTNADANASNGVVHVIDGLLIDAVDRATLTPRFTIFARLVGEAGLDSALRESGANDGRTIFAPTNEALLDALDANGNGQVENDEIPSNAADILQHHILDSVFLAEDVPTSETAVTPLSGPDLTVVRDGDSGTVTVSSDEEMATVTTADVEVDNGVIHGVDEVLLP